MSSDQFDSTGDEALSRLSRQQGADGDLVRAFLNRQGADDGRWLETWFQSRIEKHFAETHSSFDSVQELAHYPSHEGAETPAPRVKLKSIQINYFRGFREGLSPIDLGDELIIIEGPNSSGKTSLAEALEWLFSGSLSRRESGKTGNARELERCITNEFRPANEETWVTAVFVSQSEDGKNQEFTLRRNLQEDYGTSSSASCSSVLIHNDKQLSPNEERKVLDNFFADVPPLLMQHTLRDFVQGNPKQRRRYFERLLRLDELTELIRLAVVSRERESDFNRPGGENCLHLLSLLSSGLENDLSRKAHIKLMRDRNVSVEMTLAALSRVSILEFPSLIDEAGNSDDIVAELQEEQMRVRQSTFPILEKLRPDRQFSADTLNTRPASISDSLGQRLLDACKPYMDNKIEFRNIGDRNLAVAEAFKLLLEIGAIQMGRESQYCPLCAYEHADTLSADRISAIESWSQIHDAATRTRQNIREAGQPLLQLVKQSLEEYNAYLPSPPTESDWDFALQTAGDRLKEAIG